MRYLHGRRERAAKECAKGVTGPRCDTPGVKSPSLRSPGEGCEPGIFDGMTSQSFLRLPESVQVLVTEGLDAEVQSSFARIEEAQAAGDETLVRFLEGDIMRASALRMKITGEDPKI